MRLEKIPDMDYEAIENSDLNDQLVKFLMSKQWHESLNVMETTSRHLTQDSQVLIPYQCVDPFPIM